jgi:hypothetical protein
MLVYHRTHQAGTILSEGFRDGFYLMPGMGELRGIFVSADWPLDENEGADGDAVVELDIPENLFARFEHVEEGKSYREAMIPAAELNRYPVRVLNEAEEDAPTTRRWRSFERD